MTIFDEQEVCRACGQQAATSREVAQGTTTVMRERFERDEDTGEPLEPPPVVSEMVTEIIVEYTCSACGHRWQDAL